MKAKVKSKKVKVSRSLLLPFAFCLFPCAHAQTRFYLPSSGAADVSPPFTLQASWNETDNADRLKMVTTRINSAMTSKSEGKANTANTRQLVRQYVSDPLEAQTIASTVTVKGTIRVNESAANDNIDKVSLKLIVVSNDGQTLRCTLLGLGDYGPTNEWATSLTARRIADGDTISAACSVTAGDRVVIELGFNNTTAGTSITGTENFGDDAGTDLGDNETDTAANNPFLEVSQTLTFQPPPAGGRRRIFISRKLPGTRPVPAAFAQSAGARLWRGWNGARPFCWAASVPIGSKGVRGLSPVARP